MVAYYNENDPFAAAWLRELISDGLICEGDVDERSIEQVTASDVRGYTQCHFFAGIGVWSYALRNAGWPDDFPVWSGSCPCQGFSVIGEREGFSDQRHLWPVWFGIIGELQPHVVFGEQVSGADGRAWFDIVASDMEKIGYTIGALDTSAAGIGAPHLRQRLYFVGDTSNTGLEGHDRDGNHGDQPRWQHPQPTRPVATPGGFGFWGDAEWIECADGKRRAIKSEIFPLAYGVAGRVGQLRGAGNALCAPQAEAFIKAYMELGR